jgi:DNA-binding PucR family transcriptional regulator
VPLASGQALPADGLALSARDVEERAHVVVGDPEDDVGGFGRTHRQALRVEAVALAAGAARRRVTAFAEIRPIALMSGDLDGTREWVRETLGPLAADTVQNARLRETVRIYLDAGGYTAAASRLFVHTNTVHYRVQKAEEARGRPVAHDRLEVELALLACHWLGAAVLQPTQP